jgi:hypothetical protein
VDTASSEDVLAFVRGFWIPRHVESCRTVSASGSKVVAVSTIKQVVQHLSKCYSMLGRDEACLGRDLSHAYQLA